MVLHHTKKTEEDYIAQAHRKVVQIHTRLPQGTILVFMTGKDDIRQLCELLGTSRLSKDHQMAHNGVGPSSDGAFATVYSCITVAQSH